MGAGRARREAGRWRARGRRVGLGETAAATAPPAEKATAAEVAVAMAAAVPEGMVARHKNSSNLDYKHISQSSSEATWPSESGNK